MRFRYKDISDLGEPKKPYHMQPVSSPRSGSQSLDWQVWPVTMKTGRLYSFTHLSVLGAVHAAFQQARRSLSRPAAIDALSIIYKMVIAFG